MVMGSHSTLLNYLGSNPRKTSTIAIEIHHLPYLQCDSNVQCYVYGHIISQ